MQLEANDLGDQHAHRLAEHRGFGLDAANAPAEYAEPVDHGGVRIGADERVAVGFAGLFIYEDRLAEVLEVHLMADARSRRDDAEVLEGVLTPAKEDVALHVALELEVGVDEERGVGTVLVHLNRVVDDEVDRLEWVDQLRVAAELREGIAHGGEVDDGGYAGEVLQQDARGPEGNLLLHLCLDVPGRHGFNVGLLDEGAVLVAEQVLEENLEAEWQAGSVAPGSVVYRVEAVDRVRLARDVERRAALEGIQ